MPPQDFMDDTRAVTCLLGLNVDAGQEIKLRLRTNDLKGFRNYERIRETLVHELTHNVWGGHDNNFKELNSRLLRECVRVNRMHMSAHTLLGSAEVRDAESMESEPAPSPAPQVLGGRGQGPASAAQAAAAAAARRQAAATAHMAPTAADTATDVTRDFEQAADQQTQAEEAALAAWGSTGAPVSTAGPRTACAGQAHAGQPAVMPEADLAAAAQQETSDGAGHRADASAEQCGEAEHAASQGALDVRGSREQPGGAYPMEDAGDAAQMPSEVVHEAVQSIGQTLWQQHGGDALVALRTVQSILRNAAEKQEPKYRCIRRRNEVFAARVAPFPAAEALLTVAGFQLQDDAWTLPPQHSSHTLVRVHAEVAQVLQSCQ